MKNRDFPMNPFPPGVSIEELMRARRVSVTSRDDGYLDVTYETDGGERFALVVASVPDPPPRAKKSVLVADLVALGTEGNPHNSSWVIVFSDHELYAKLEAPEEQMDDVDEAMARKGYKAYTFGDLEYESHCDSEPGS